MAYTHTTLSTLRAQLAARLHDTSMVFFVSAELDAYINEALRTFQAFSGFYRDRGTFNTVAATSFYYLPAQLSTLLPYAVTDRATINLMQYHLLEPATSVWAGGWTGTEMFTMDDVTKALQRRRDQFLVDTGVVCTQSTTAFPAPPIGRVTLADTIMDLRRAVWLDVDSVYHHLWRSDEWAMNAFDYRWALDASSPYCYSVLAPPPLTVQISPIPADAGTLDHVTVNAGAALTPTASSSYLNVPDDYVWGVKWGALADLLGKDGPAQDQFRAAYCEKRYRLCCELARVAPCVIQTQYQGVNVFVSSLAELDAYAPSWQNETSAAPTDIALVGRNLLAVRPTPDGVYSITCDVVRNAPTLSLDADNVQLGREQLDGIIDYAEHLAAFKMGGEEFGFTMRQADNFLRTCLNYNNRLSASAAHSLASAIQSFREEVVRPRISPETIGITAVAPLTRAPEEPVANA